MKVQKIIIVGGVAGGASAATRLRRLDENAEIIVLERGEHVSFANCGLPYHIGGSIKERRKLLLQTPRSLHDRFKLDVRVRQEVTAIHRASKTVTVKNLETGKVYKESYDKLILSPGAEPINPPMPGIEHTLTLRNLADMDAIIKRIETTAARRAVVIGGGFIGLEMAENLHERGLKVNVIEAAPQIMGLLDTEMAALVQRELERHGIQIHLSETVTALEHDGRVALLKSGARLETDVVVVGIGVRPDTRLAAAAGLSLGARGGIVVTEQLQTSDPDIYAVGDATEKTNWLGDAALIPLAWAANRQGRLVADHIMGADIRVIRHLGTAIVKIFGLTAASTGMNERSLRAKGLPYQVIHTHPASHASYYPGAEQISLKLLYNPETDEIWGAQAVGKEGTDKRIDVLATAIQGGIRASALSQLELAYAPPYSSAKDPVNMLGYVTENVRAGMRVTQWHEVGSDTILVDVRDRKEFSAGHLGNALHIPLNELRARQSELPRQEFVLYCQVGLRGYLAQRLLTQLGFEVSNLDGGIVTIQAARPELIAQPVAPALERTP